MGVNRAEPEFLRPILDVSRNPVTDQSAIHSLPDLIDFNAEHNPDLIFSLQEIRQEGKHVDLTALTFRELKNATISCAHLIRKSLAVEDGDVLDKRPIALLLESDINLFVHLAALLYMNIPVLVLSIRLSPAAISHLLESTSVRAIITSQRTQVTAENALKSPQLQQQKGLQLIPSCSFQELVQLSPLVKSNTLKCRKLSDRETAIILHSSGTTGLPKPIFLAHRYLLGYAACHRLKPDQCLGKRNVSTLPMYHGFGLLGPCISLATGKTCCFPSASVIPSATSVAELIQKSASSSLMTVPSILEEVKSNPALMQALKGLEFVAVGGGAIKPAVGELLVSNGVKLLNHYGATEIGAIAPIFVPGDDYDWRYLRIRTDMGLEIKTVEAKNEDGNLSYQLVGYPFGWDGPFVIQDLLRRRSESAHLEVAILGRNDDLLVLSTGEKVLPNALEMVLSRQEGVKAAVVFGQNREEVGVLIDPEVPLQNAEVDRFVGRIWSVVQKENISLDRHARISSKGMILIKPSDTTLPRSDKGSVMRRETYDLFSKEIEDLYANSSTQDTSSFELENHPDKIVTSLRAIVQICVQDRGLPVANWSDSDDWFELGMDSLEATRLARLLSRVSNKHSFPAIKSQQVLPSFIYQNPSFKALSSCLLADGGEGTISGTSSHSITKQMLGLAVKYASARLESRVILLTGSTGHLGVHILNQLSRNPNVSQIICLSRSHQGQEFRDRQQKANIERGINLSESAWEKITFLSSAQLHQPRLGLPDEDYRRLVRTVTHVIHNAWPMDFQRGLSSFEPQIETVHRLVTLCEDCYRKQKPSTPPQLLFTSSIAVAAHSPYRKRLPEAPILDPSVTAGLGYAQAKWVCERILIEAAKTRGHFLHPSIVRLGQLTGSTESGKWNSKEHFPAILKASQLVGSLPELEGTFSWIPIDIAAGSILDILFSRQIEPLKGIVYHIENPIRQSWKPLLPVIAHQLNLDSPLPVPFPAWLERVRSFSGVDTDLGFIHAILPFLQEEFEVLSSGGVVFDTVRARRASRSLRACNGVSIDLLNLYIEAWRKEGFLE